MEMHLKRLILVLLPLAGCADQSNMTPEEARRHRLEAEAARIHKLEDRVSNDNNNAAGDPHQMEDEAYENAYPDSVKALDRQWCQTFSFYYFDQQYPYDKAIVQADKTVGKPTHAWPPGYFDRR
jgi:hypothetical protein